MLSAKETLKKLADALNISVEENVEAPEVATEEVAEVVEETTKTEETIEETASEVVEEVVETEETAEVADEQEVTEEVKTEETEEVKEVKEDPRLAELEAQIATLKEILKNTMAEPMKEEASAPAEDKGLTHSPEKSVKSSHTKIGDKGSDPLSRVFKYINNK